MQLQIKMKYSIPFVKHAALCKSLLFYFVSSSMWQDFITLPFLHLYHFLNCFSFITTKSQNKIATSIFEIGWWIHEWKRKRTHLHLRRKNPSDSYCYHHWRHHQRLKIWERKVVEEPLWQTWRRRRTEDRWWQSGHWRIKKWRMCRGML